MPKAIGYLTAKLNGSQLFTACLNSMKSSSFKYVSSDEKSLSANYKSGASIANNSWGEKVSIRVSNNDKGEAQALVASENMGKDTKFHEQNVKGILEIISKELYKAKAQGVQYGLVPASQINKLAGAATTTWFVYSQTEENQESDDSEGFWGSGFFG